MPRTGGVYTEPAGTKGTPNTTIQSAPYNAFVDDLVGDANAARPITAGGTGATTASGARTALGLAIGTDVQAYDADLAAMAALTPTDNNFIVGNGTAWVAESGATARTSMGANDASNLTAGTVADARLPTTQAGKTFSSTVNVWAGGSTGRVTLVPGGASTTGFVEFLTAAGPRAGYIGNADSSAIGIIAQAGWHYNFFSTTSADDPTVNGGKMWHAGNDGAGSGLDANLLNGLNSSNAATASTIAARDASGGLSGSTLYINNTVANGRFTAYYTSSSLRWQAGADSIAETGSNAGSNWALYRYSDAGAFLGTALDVNRANGAVTIAGSIVANGGVALGTNQAVTFSGTGAAATRANLNITQDTQAWLNFNGTGTPASISNRNIASITDNGTGDYTINFTTVLPSTNYGLVGTAVSNTTSQGIIIVNIHGTLAGGPTTKTTSACRVLVNTSNTGSPVDAAFATLAFIGG